MVSIREIIAAHMDRVTASLVAPLPQCETLNACFPLQEHRNIKQ